MKLSALALSYGFARRVHQSAQSAPGELGAILFGRILRAAIGAMDAPAKSLSRASADLAPHILISCG